MADLVPARRNVDPQEVVRALKGDKELMRNFPGDYFAHGQWQMYNPGDQMDKDPEASLPPMPKGVPMPPKYYIPPNDWMHDKVAHALFGTPPQQNFG